MLLTHLDEICGGSVERRTSQALAQNTERIGETMRSPSKNRATGTAREKEREREREREREGRCEK
jgi:hypothetical protein